jgi:HPt (histidine-containing phosphotransfer) domain-containing protein
VSRLFVSDLDAALKSLEGDRELLRRIAQLFLTQAPQLLEEIREAVSARNAPALERAAHKLRGSVTNFEARNTYNASLRLENMGHAGDLSGGAEAYAELEHAMMELERVLVEFSKDCR